MNRFAVVFSILVILPAFAACDRASTPQVDSAMDEEVPELVLVAERGDTRALDAILKRDPRPDVRDHCDFTPLMKAALNGHAETLERLLAAGAAVDAEDKGGYTSLMLAASNNHAAIVERLAAQGAMVDHQEATQGWTALIWAAKQGHAEAVKALLARRADATLRDFSGRTPADWARETGDMVVLELLGEKG
jgi:uncharacterized protein